MAVGVSRGFSPAQGTAGGVGDFLDEHQVLQPSPVSDACGNLPCPVTAGGAREILDAADGVSRGNSPAQGTAGGAGGFSEFASQPPVRPSLWTGPLDPVQAPHAATGLIQGFRPRDRHFRGWCEVCLAASVVSGGAGSGLPGPEHQNQEYPVCFFVEGGGVYRQTPRSGEPPGVSGGIAQCLHCLRGCGVDALLDAVGLLGTLNVRRSSFDHWRLGGSTTARWDLVVWYPPGVSAPDPAEVPDQPWIPLSGRIDKQVRPPPPGAPCPVVQRVEGADVIRTNGLFPAGTLDQRVWLPDDRSPTKFGRRSLAWEELCDLWDVPISVVDQAAKDETDMVLLRALFDSPPAKFLELGADALLIGFGRGGVPLASG
ncbi:LOW QUALITY PROTEIN: hypothetical protein ACHAXR_002586 [Thalassiosira sp. AJA248-18]